MIGQQFLVLNAIARYMHLKFFIQYSFLSACFIFPSFFLVVESFADQDDPDLDFLFSLLLKAENQEQGNLITNEIWKRWLLVDNSEVSDLLSAGINAMSQNKLVVALSLFDKVAEKSPRLAEGWNKRATVYYLLGMNSNSIKDIQKTLQLEPRHFGAMAGLAWISLEQGNYETAEAVLKKTLSINPFLIDVQRQLGMLQERKEKQSIRFRLKARGKDDGVDTL